jgi:hypothetical protein
MVGRKPARKVRLLAADEGIVEMLLNGELSDLGNLSVVELDFIDGAGRMRLGCQGRTKDGRGRAVFESSIMSIWIADKMSHISLIRFINRFIFC